MTEKKKIGIITIIDYYNYGNRLQNYAVSHILNDRLGHEAITLEGYNHPEVQGSFVSRTKEQIALQLCRFPEIAEKRLNSNMVRWYNFSEWSEKWIPRRRFYSCQQLPKYLNDQFDLFFVGSDQVWNYRIRNLRLDDFFLTFADDKKKCSISASFGTDELADSEEERYRSSLSEFAHISVREKTGAKIIRNLIGREVPVLVDPVMMLSPDEWMRVEKKPRVDISKPYVLKYYLGKDEKSIDTWASENGYIVYDLMDKNNRKLYSAGPGEFLSLVRNASLVCSDSFHCIAFSILFSRPFIVYERQGTENYMASRLETLLEKFGLQNRWERFLKPEEYMECNFAYGQEKLKKEQKAFWLYLTTAMQEREETADKTKAYLADRKTCTGCSACANACPMKCIGMKEDAYGFLFPVIMNESACISCGTCRKVCPVQSNTERKNVEPKAYAAFSKDDDLRMESSSGGVFSELADEVLKLGGAVYGASYSDIFEIRHICVEKRDDLWKLRGAKYAESELGYIFVDIENRLKEGKPVLFAGTPCQTTGLKCFLKRDYENLFLVDFICHGIPSPMVWREYVKYRAKHDADGELPVEINLREKSSGWSRYQYSNYFRYPEGKEYREISTKSVYMKLFTEDYITRESCGNCKFKGYSRCSDITLGDFWGIWNIYSEMDDNKGTSAVLIQSEKGHKFWNQIKERIKFKEVQLEQVSRQNPSLLVSSQPKAERTVVLEKIRVEGFGIELPRKQKDLSLWKKVKRIIKRISSGFSGKTF